MNVLASDAMPLNVGYMKAVMDRDLGADCDARVFAYPDRLLSAMRQQAPDVLMLSNYTWNEQISRYFARMAKAMKPDTLVVMGGPNIHDEPERQRTFLAERPELDWYVLGEGDFLAAEIVQHFADCGLSFRALSQRDIASSIYRRSDELIRHDIVKRTRNLDDIPSPWLTGIMDEFFDGKLAPLWETNRGCPFTCTFCVQGTKYYNRVTYFDKERLREEIQYIGKRIKAKCPSMGVLRIADPNYGMYARDPEISGYLGNAQHDFGWPSYIDATTGKNRPERVIESMERVGGALVLWQSVQSLDEDVLRNIKRENIRLDAYSSLNVHIRGRGLKSSSDLILALPGETLETHLASLTKMIDAGVARVHNFQCLLLKGTELERTDSRAKFSFKTKYRMAQKSFGVYDGDAVFEPEEIVVSTDSLSFEHYLRARAYHFVCGVYVNQGRLDTLFEFCESLAVKRSDLFLRLFDAVTADAGEVGEYLAAFLRETRGELFNSPEELKAFYDTPENIEKLSQGEIGDNIVYKYSAIARLRAWNPFAAVALATAKQLLVDHGARERVPDFEEFWSDFGRFIVMRSVTGMTAEQLTRPVATSVRYDIASWLGDGCPAETGKYRLPINVEAEFRLSDAHAKELKQAVAVWGLSNSGLGMLLRRVSFNALERDIVLHTVPADPQLQAV
ncbi:MAG: cobalamin B12-binding domain-containing protein [Gammaproteobacteria bacterium]|nr:cobalamin B12-binding domain-containing protein [Gammaproteobacteria bacterium]